MRSGLLFLIVLIVGLSLSTNSSGGITKFVTAIISGKVFKKNRPVINRPLIQQQQEEQPAPKKLEEQQFDLLNDSSTFGTLKRVSTQSDGDNMEISFKKNKFDKGKKPKSLGELLTKKEQEQFDLDLDKIINEINQQAKQKDNL